MHSNLADRTSSAYCALAEWAGATSSEERAFFYALAIPFVALNPLMLALHGYIWVSTGGTSSVAAIYAMKLSPVVYLALVVASFGPREILAAVANRFTLMFAPLYVISLVSPLFYTPRPSNFYFAADALGILTTIMCILVTLRTLRRSPDFLRILFNTIMAGAVVTSVIIIIYYLISNGYKVSIPPDIHFGTALVFLFVLSSRHPSWALRAAAVVVAAGISASQFRMQMIVAAFSIAAGLAWTFLHHGRREIVQRAAEAAVLVMVVLYSFGSAASETLARLIAIESEGTFSASHPSGKKGSTDDQRLQGVTADQRLIEIRLAVSELAKAPVAFVTGRGFGATADNTDNILKDKPDRLHSIHNSFFALLLRNGVIGAVVFLAPTLFALYTLFTQRRTLYIASAGLLVMYIACMTDQYVYWGGYFALSLASWLHAWRFEATAPEKGVA